MKNMLSDPLLWVALALLAFAVFGCQSSAYNEGDYQGQGLTASYAAPAVPGAVVSTHADGSQTVAPLPATPTAQAVVVPPNASPVVSVSIIPTTPGVVTSYVVTPEIQKGDKLAGSRVMTWAGEAPGTVNEKVATQKVARVHNALPAVTVDATGVHASAGGGSTDTQAGQSWFQRLCVWFNDLFKDFAWWVVLGIGLIAAFVILPMIAPPLKPFFSAITGAFHGAWTYITGEFSKLFAWIASFHKTPAPPVTAPALVMPVATVTAVDPTATAVIPTATQIQNLTTQVQQATETK